MSEEELTKAIEGLGMDEGDGEGNILPIMQSIMQNLLSKDVLYPSLKEITEKVCELLFLLFLLFSSVSTHVGYFVCLEPTEMEKLQYTSPFVFSLLCLFMSIGESWRGVVSLRE